MPQLDTIYILLLYVWTWALLLLTTQKIKTFKIISGPKKQEQTKPHTPQPTLPWT